MKNDDMQPTNRFVILGFTLLVLVGLFALEWFGSFVSSLGLFLLGATIAQIKVSFLLFSGLSLIAFFLGSVDGFKGSLKIVLITSVIFLVIDILINKIAAVLLVALTNFSFMSVVSTGILVITWVLLFVVAAKKIFEKASIKAKTQNNLVKNLAIVVAGAFIVGLSYFYDWMSRMYMPTSSFEEMSSMEMIDFMSRGSDPIFEIISVLTLMAWWLLFAACVWRFSQPRTED